VAGARWVQESVLQTHPDANLRVYAIWFAMYATDLRERWPSNILTDARVRHWWDEDKQVGRWYAERMRQMEERLAPGSAALGGTILWDSYLVYGPDARWDDAPSDLRRWGRPIFATRDSLIEALDAAVRRTE
jgi:hypothetical protein